LLYHDTFHSVEQPSATLDTSFWINAFRAGLLERLGGLFRLTIPDAVVAEIRYPVRHLGVPSPDTAVLEAWLASGQLRRENPKRSLAWFGPGEAAAIALAEEHGYFLLMDDGRPYQHAKVRGIRVVGTPDLVVMLYDRQQVVLQEARAMLGSLLGINTRIVGAASTLLEAIAGERGEGR
jgi:predicted nucleic acid-binding protein